jgi:hypothetical protein
MRRRVFALSGLAGGAVAASVAYRRRLAGRRERLDVYFEDGSFVTHLGGSPEGEQLLPFARHVVAAVRRPPAEWPPE